MEKRATKRKRKNKITDTKSAHWTLIILYNLYVSIDAYVFMIKLIRIRIRFAHLFNQLLHSIARLLIRLFVHSFVGFFFVCCVFHIQSNRMLHQLIPFAVLNILKLFWSVLHSTLFFFISLFSCCCYSYRYNIYLYFFFAIHSTIVVVVFV